MTVFHVEGTPLTVNSADLTALYAQLNVKDAVTTTQGVPRGDCGEGEEKEGRGATIEDLMAGEWQEFYGSQSEADLG